jgi:hypothetical protein
MENKKAALYETIKGLTVEKYDFKAQAQTLRNSTNEFADQCEKRVAECQSIVTKMLASYDETINEAQTEAAKIKADATKEATAIFKKAQDETKLWEAEKARLAHTQDFKSQIKLNIGGVKMITSLTTLQRFPDTMIGAMFSGRHALPLDDEGYFFIDRDGTHFRHILNFLRQPEGFRVDLPAGQVLELKRECEYYGLLELMFTFTPAAPVSVTSTRGTVLLVTQDKDALWYADKTLLKVCRTCFVAEGKNHHYCIASFTTTPHVREIAAAQPEPSTCSNCGAQAKR